MNSQEIARRSRLRNPRHAALASNFCGLPAPDRCKFAKPAQQLGAVIEQFIASSIGRSNRLQLLIELWPQIVGMPLCNFCQPSGIRGKTVSVRAANCSAAHELDLQTDRILERMNSLPNIGSLQKLRIVT
ncbi:MAG: DUF721 domain-containing protein [Puniceicoccales bacterium]|nr:DUF721 domain-containing protein [Puniceicoccales bacterium]